MRQGCLDFTLTFKELEKFNTSEDIPATIEKLLSLMPSQKVFLQIKTPDMKKFELNKVKI